MHLNSTKIYMVQNYFICCAGNINECLYMYLYTPCVHLYGRDQLTVQYSLLGGEYHWSGKQERLFQCCQKAKQAWCDISIVCAVGRFFRSHVREQRNGEMSFSLSLTGLRRRLCLSFRRTRWKQSRDYLENELWHLVQVCITKQRTTISSFFQSLVWALSSLPQKNPNQN